MHHGPPYKLTFTLINSFNYLLPAVNDNGSEPISASDNWVQDARFGIEGVTQGFVGLLGLLGKFWLTLI